MLWTITISVNLLVQKPLIKCWLKVKIDTWTPTNPVMVLWSQMLIPTSATMADNLNCSDQFNIRFNQKR